ncbi:MAG: hypothetical protein GXP62_11725, partial [Oligoflexia bacterium]|nr:hypothetical protein [Oligoflexia bacterium]
MRLSRLVWSPYETAADRSAERLLLSEIVELVPDDADAEILVTTSNRRVDLALLESHPSTRLVITTTSGHDHVDLIACGQRDVAVVRLPEARRDAVVDVALALVLRGLHRLGTLEARARQGVWARRELPSLSPCKLSGSRLGIIGLGVIGRRLAELGRALGAQVFGADPRGLPVGVPAMEPAQMMRRCAAVSLHCSLTDSSRGLMSATMLARAQGLVLVNTSRGQVLDPVAAVAALDSGGLAFLGVDVFPSEPWPDMAAVVERPELVLLPHAAGYHQGLSAMVRQGIFGAVRAFLASDPLP